MDIPSNNFVGEVLEKKLDKTLICMDLLLKFNYFYGMRFKISIVLFCAVLYMGFFSAAVAAPVLPGPADPGRIGKEDMMKVPDRGQDDRVAIPSIVPSAPVPAGAEKIRFVLKAVEIEGITAFTPKQMADLYAPYIGKKVGLDVAWKIVDAITRRYHETGYFLSRAYVPEQKIKDGVIHIRIVEGYIKKVDLDLPDDIEAYRLIKLYIARLVAQQPVEAEAVESFLLRINDLPGYSFRGVLSPMQDQKGENAVKLTLVPSKKENKGSLTFDNYSSRYLDPNEVSAAYTASLFSLQQTTVSGIANLSTDKLRHAAVSHSIVVAPDFKLTIGADITESKPGYTLKRFDIDSVATSENISLEYQWIRQREENLSLKFTLDNKDVVGDTLASPLTRDHIHAFRTGAIYDVTDSWRGYNIVTSNISQGLDFANSSQKTDRYLSRAGAVPDFTKIEWSASRLQTITADWMLYAAASGQWSPDTLYSSEQFGYGGQTFGRAYNTSEITGDSGISGSMELRYGAYSQWEPIALQPYVFLDYGEVWAKNFSNKLISDSGASFGLGLHYTTVWHQYGNFSLAWPLISDIATPIYGASSQGPRLVFQISQEF